ncbi:Uu.00g025370.m01.CDS01 [Anthostomella pinea]|uniref:alpha-glucosidase n=1 Tax=Anthostomella pinea TaxID=933095 RepID=A0AAI8V7A8_9PEZI|nr:Uu.00g025370.m01.CDS01 [Anthostomella pinea]
MKPVSYMNEWLWPATGQPLSTIIVEPSTSSQLVPWPLLQLFLAKFGAWYDHLAPIPRLILVISLVSSSSITVYSSGGRLHHQGTMTRAIRLLVLSLLGLFGIILAQQSAPIATRDEGDGAPVIPNIIDPNAVNAQSVCPGYKASNVKETGTGFTADLVLADDACNVYGTDIEVLDLVVEYQAADRLHVEILPKYIGQENYTWFVLPESLIPKPQAEAETAPSSDLDFSWSNEPTFSFNVTRKSTGDTLFTTHGSRIVYEDQFIEFGSSLPENYNLYGLGEVIHGFRLGNNLTRTLYAADVGDIIDANIYGSHPIYLDTRYFEVDENGSLTYAPNATDKSAHYESFTHGVFQRNAHAQEVLLREANITWRALGGSIDLYFYEGPSQDEVTKSYQTSAVGLPAMQQYWTFGFHQCRWGYKNWSEVKDVVDSFAKHEIPLETIWNDIDYMKAYRDFENDPINYPYSEGVDFLERLHQNNQHYVPIIDSGIYAPDPKNASDAYPSFDRGVEQEAFMLNPDGSLYIGEVWPGLSVFGDWIGALFNGTGANRWWISEVARYHSKIAFDGIWIDMSEVSSFCVGSCGSSNRSYGSVDATPGAPSTSTHNRNINYPPYTINNFKGDLADHTVSPNGTHHGGTLEYDFHNVWGHQLLNATYHALLDIFPKKRPFIIGRSQFAGSGNVAGHWGCLGTDKGGSGDNYSYWAYLYFSIPQALSFSLFGIPMFGVDTCGFADSVNEELCNRWMQLSAFFPFYRNHNEINAIGQEPYLWSSVAEASRVAMRIRYALLPYIYTTFYLSHSTGSTTMRALMWEFPNEPWLANADRQFLLGPAIMVTPCLVEGATTVDGVFPGVGSGNVWYDWYNLSAITGVSQAQNVTIDAPLGHIPLYVRGGHVLPMHEPAMTTTTVRASPWSLLVALDRKGEAAGGLYLDDGESLVPDATTWVDLSASASSLTAKPTGDFVDANALGNVTILGVQGTVSKVELSGIEVNPDNWNLDASKMVLQLTGLDALTSDGAWSAEWTLSWS